jgi:sporulation protein YlmC with PRC-barrel domain
MLARSLIAGAAGCLLLASTALAAETSTTSTATDSSFHGTWRASKVVGLNVYNDKNENIGSINDLLMDKGGSIKAAVISVGGFLGVGSRLVALPYEKLKFSTEPVAYTGASNAPAGGTANGTKPPSTSTTTGSTSNAPATSSKPNPWYPDHAMINATKDELQKMPEFKYSTD